MLFYLWRFVDRLIRFDYVKFYKSLGAADYREDSMLLKRTIELDKEMSHGKIWVCMHRCCWYLMSVEEDSICICMFVLRENIFLIEFCIWFLQWKPLREFITSNDHALFFRNLISNTEATNTRKFHVLICTKFPFLSKSIEQGENSHRRNVKARDISVD